MSDTGRREERDVLVAAVFVLLRRGKGVGGVAASESHFMNY